MAAGGAIGLAAFAAGVPGPFHGLFNIDLALLVAFAVSPVALVGESLTDRSPRCPEPACPEPVEWVEGLDGMDFSKP